MRPSVGLSPTSPQYDAGRTLEPIVCVPSASGTVRAATAAAEPLDEPPGVHARFHGLRAGDGSYVANSVVWHLPRRIAPALLSRATDVASYDGTKPAITLEPPSVRARRCRRCPWRRRAPRGADH